MGKTYTTTQAAEILGVSQARVRQMVRAGRLQASKVGRDLFIDEKDLKLVEDRRPGRPPKAGGAKKGAAK